MGLSLLELRNELVGKGGITVTANYGHLNHLKDIVNNMLTVRSTAISPTCTTVFARTGSSCTGHTSKRTYDSTGTSLRDIQAFSDAHLKRCTCDTVKTTGCECMSNQSCECVSNDSCDCESRSGCSWHMDDSCDCQGVQSCDCESRSGYCDGYAIEYGGVVCDCEYRCGDVSTCSCQSVCSNNCVCNSESDCDWYVTDCGCDNRTGCACNTRCSCNAVRNFS